MHIGLKRESFSRLYNFGDFLISAIRRHGFSQLSNYALFFLIVVSLFLHIHLDSTLWFQFDTATMRFGCERFYFRTEEFAENQVLQLVEGNELIFFFIFDHKKYRTLELRISMNDFEAFRAQVKSNHIQIRLE